MPKNKTPRPCVSALLVHRGKILVCRRSRSQKHYPGYWSSPGGKLISSDGDPSHESSYLNALKRELSEEVVGPNWDEFKFRPYWRSLTPSWVNVRFDVRTYICELDEIPDFELCSEFDRWEWMSPAEVREFYQKGTMLVVPPVLESFLNLGSFNDSQVFQLSDLAIFAVPIQRPMVDLEMLMPLTKTLPPADRVNCLLVEDGDGHALVDASCKDEQEFDAFLASLNQRTITKVICSHHHGDHCSHVLKVARSLGVSIWATADTLKRLKKRFGDLGTYVEISDGDLVAQSYLGSVEAVALPGHDSGMIGLLASHKRWMYVSDLFQGVGTVVVGGEEGDMNLYFRSLERVIEIAPDVVVPSHGIALGGTAIIERTLKHRLLREQQVLELHQDGKTPGEITRLLYFDLPDPLIPYARANVDSHLQKILEIGLG